VNVRGFTDRVGEFPQQPVDDSSLKILRLADGFV